MSELRRQFSSALLVVLTVAAVFSALINFQQQKKFHLPDDGATWIERQGSVRAFAIVPGGPAQKAGLQPADLLLKIQGQRVQSALEVTQFMTAAAPWKQMRYEVARGGVEFTAKVILAEAAVSPLLYYQYAVGVVYLLVGLLVYFRRSTAPKAEHFYILCLLSFIFSSFHYSGKLNDFDQVIYWGNVLAGLFAPTVFLHFALSFPEPRPWLRSALRSASLYVPAVLLGLAYFAFAKGFIRNGASPLEIRWSLDRLALVFWSLLYLAGAAVLVWRYRSAGEPILRQQLKWLRNGAIVGVLPVTLGYILPYAFGTTLPASFQLCVLSLVLIPLTWAYAIVRHKLLEVDIIFQQGYLYTLATIVVLGLFYGLLFSFGNFEEHLNPTAVVCFILVATFLFQPIRNYIQEQLDRYYFYKDRYDYRLTLIEFARELTAETDLERTLEHVADRLLRTLSIRHVAFLLADEETGEFHLHMTAGKPPERPVFTPDLSFLRSRPAEGYYFFERTRGLLDRGPRGWSPSIRQTLAQLDLTYYLPCSVRGRTIAYLGISRSNEGDFLNREDVELILTLSGYVGIAIENSRLYRSLQTKVDEFERLKEFSENIVESINVGILATDLGDQVESWNSQMERLTGIARDYAVGKHLAELLPLDLYDQVRRVWGESGIHHLYKFVYRPDGADRELILNLAIAPLVSKDEEQIGRLVIVDDVTDRADLEQRLIQADKLSSIGLLAAGVAHEVNTPLAVISTYAQLLAKQVNGDQSKSVLLEKIAKQTFRASEIVNSLLNFSRTSPSQFVDVDLNKVVRETLSLIHHQLDKAQVRVEMQADEQLPVVKGNAGKLQQVFLNLFLNSRDAMEGGGRLTIRTWSDEERSHIQISDTGSGIAPEHLARIYDPFFTTKAGQKGTGLGLSVSYGIVQEHAGSIQVKSQMQEGTCFHLEFPMARKPVHV